MLAEALGQEHFESHRLSLDHCVLCITIRLAKRLNKFLASVMAQFKCALDLDFLCRFSA